MNELCLIITSYFLFFCTNWLNIDLIEVRYGVGFLYMSVIFFITFANVTVVGISQALQIRMHRKKMKAAKAWKEYMKKKDPLLEIKQHINSA